MKSAVGVTVLTGFVLSASAVQVQPALQLKYAIVVAEHCITEFASATPVEEMRCRTHY